MAKKSKNNKLLYIIIAVIVILSGSLGISKMGADNTYKEAGLREELPEGEMTVSFIDVGQADCTLVTCDDTAILIDGGEVGSSQTVINYLRNYNIGDIDLCIATHPHSDHIGGLPDVFNAFEIKDVIMPEIPKAIIPTSNAYKNFLQAVSQNAENVIPATVGETYSYGDITVEIIAPIKDYDDLNTISVVAKMTYGDTSFVVTGDAEEEAELDIINKGFDCGAQLLKIGHHGSKSSSCEEWLSAVNPEFAVISCGLDNTYGHPHKEVIKRLEKYGIEYYRTDLIGTVVFSSDGSSFERIDNNKN